MQTCVVYPPVAMDVTGLLLANEQMCAEVRRLQEENTKLRMQLNSALHELHLAGAAMRPVEVKTTQTPVQVTECGTTQTTVDITECATQATVEPLSVVSCAVQCAPMSCKKDACVDTYSCATEVELPPSAATNAADIEQKMWLLATTFTAHPNLQT